MLIPWTECPHCQKGHYLPQGIPKGEQVRCPLTHAEFAVDQIFTYVSLIDPIFGTVDISAASTSGPTAKDACAHLPLKTRNRTM